MSEHDALRMTMSLRDARVVLTALDLYMRIHMGQLSELRHHLFQHIEPGRIDEIERTINRLHALFFPQLGGSPGASFGIANTPHYDARRAYDIYQVLRHREAWTRLPEGPKAHGFSVIFDTPRPVTTDPPPVVEAISLLEHIAAAATEEEPNMNAASTKPIRVIEATGDGVEDYEKEGKRYSWRAYQVYLYEHETDVTDLNPGQRKMHGESIVIERELPRGQFRVSRISGAGRDHTFAQMMDHDYINDCKSWAAVGQALMSHYDCNYLREYTGTTRVTQVRVTGRK